MSIRSKFLPQADDLDVLYKVLKAVDNGAQTDQDIALILGYDSRQGRYYRLAGELLGLLSRYKANTSELTSRGIELLNSSAEKRLSILRQSVLSMPLFHRFIPFLESFPTQSCTRIDIEHFLRDLFGTTESMVKRRTSTLVAWSLKLDILRSDDNKFRLQVDKVNENIIQYTEDSEPLLPPRHDLRIYTDVQKRAQIGKVLIEYSVNAALRERANNTHAQLVSLVASRLRKIGAIPRCNRYVDLAANIDNKPYLYEVKTTTETNVVSQVRKGISQLYEYRYLQGIANAGLVLIIERPFEAKFQWLIDYLINDRNILLAWDGNGTQFFYPDELKGTLSYL